MQTTRASLSAEGVVNLRRPGVTAAEVEHAARLPGVRRIVANVSNWKQDLAAFERLVPAPIELGLVRVAEPRFPELRGLMERLVEVEVHGGRWSEASLAALARASRLEALELTGGFHDDDARVLADLPALRDLSMGVRDPAAVLSKLAAPARLKRLLLAPTEQGGPDFAPGFARALAPLVGLEQLDLFHWQVGAEALDATLGAPGALAGFTALGCRLRVGEARAFARHPRLRRLDLSHNELRDSATKPLASLADLEGLRLGFNQHLGDKAMPALATLTRLRSLHLQRTKVSPAGLRTLADGGFSQTLSELWLDSVAMNDQAAGEVSRFRALRQLGFMLGHITAAGARSLASLPDLEGLVLHGTSLDRSAATILADVDPRVEIRFNGCRFESAEARAPLDARSERLGHPPA